MDLARTRAVLLLGAALLLAPARAPLRARAEPPQPAANPEGEVPPRAPARARLGAGTARPAPALKRLERALRAAQPDVAAITTWAATAMPTDALHSAPVTASEASAATAFIKIAEPFVARVPALAPHLAEAYARSGDFARAHALLEQAWQAADAAPAQPVAAQPVAAQPVAAQPMEDATLSVASLAHALGDAALSERILRSGLMRAPRSDLLLAGLGLLLVSTGRADEALPYLGARRSTTGQRALTRPFTAVGADLAYALMASGAPEAARALLSRGCDADPESCAALRVRAALESGEVQEALRTAEDALARASRDVSLQYLAAEAALRVGDLARARALYEQIAAQHPDELRAREALRALSGE